MVILSVLAGWYTIDFLTGVYHWFIDHRKPSDPVIGRQVAEFQEHHADPLSMERHGFLSRVGMPATAGLAALGLAFLFWPAFWLTVFVGALVSQQAHYWAHTARPPFVVRVLQQLGVLIHPDAHSRHHRDFERSYGILNGWSHGALDLMLGRLTC